LAPDGSGRLGLDEQRAGAFRKLLTRRVLMSRDDRNRGVRHERATLRNKTSGRGALLGHIRT
jgi:hypothetical protein